LYLKGGGGGAGGYGAVVTSGAFTNILRDVTGGKGGNGGNASLTSWALTFAEFGGSGGSGGIGLLFTNPSGSEVQIGAAVKGGGGGSAGSGRGQFTSGLHDFKNTASAGAGGVGIRGQNLQIVMGNGGSVTGGLSGDGVRAPAIQFTGGVNSLTIQNGATIASAITGQVLAFSAKDSLVLDSGASNTSFDVGLFGQYVNFGQVIKTGPGLWRMTGLGSSPALNIQSGGISVAGANWKIGGNSINSGFLSVAAGSALHIQGTLTNAGGTFNNDGSFEGDLAISGGTVAVRGTGNIVARPDKTESVYVGKEPFRYSDGFTRWFDVDAQVFTPGSGVVNLTNPAGTFDISATNSGAEILTLEGVTNSHVDLGAKTLTIANGSTTYAGVIQGSGGLTIAGGKQVLSGINTYTGNTTVNGGNLDVNGSIASSSAVLVNSGGTLSGSGDLGRGALNGGTVSPGNSIGTLHVDGDFTMARGSDYYVQINGETSDLIKVAGSANIQSSVFEIAHDSNTQAPPVLPGKTYTILTTIGGLADTSPEVAIADFPFLTFILSGDGYNAYLTTARGPGAFAELASTPNQAAVANALDTATSTLAWRQVVRATEAQARAAFSSLSNASIHASAAGVLSDQSHFLRDAVLDRLRQDFPVGPAADPDSVLTYGAAPGALPTKKAPTVVAPLGPVYAVWAQGLGGWGSLGGNGNVARTNDSIGGVISGVDVTFNRMFRLGFAGGYSQSNFNSVNIPASGSADSYHFAVYGGWQDGPGLCAAAAASPGTTSARRGRSRRSIWAARRPAAMSTRRGRASSRARAISPLARPHWSPSPMWPTCMSAGTLPSRVSRR
jgi:outer membrane autotransporter protein